MALFGSKNKKKASDAESQQEAGADASTGTGRPGKLEDNHLHDVLRRPRITEKAAFAMDENVYTFDVAPEANKIQIKQAVRAAYGVMPEKVRTVNIPKKRVRSRRGKPGSKGGGKKAYVYLKDGDSIDLV